MLLPIQEVVSVLWTLVRLRPIRHLKMQQHMRLRDALFQRYQQLLHSQAAALQQLNKQRKQSTHYQQQQQQQQETEQQQQLWQQQKQEVLQQVSLFTHGAVLLACARLGMSPYKQLQAGSSALICKVGGWCRQ